MMRNLLVLVALLHLSKGRVFKLGYITGSKRRPWDKEYPRPGLSISGAISLAVDVVNTQKLIPDGQLEFVIAETYGEEEESIRLTAQLWRENITAIIGPQETCVHEGKLASSFDLPMVSYFCTNYETSNKRLFRTFARTRPPDTQISKSVASVLLKYNWKKVAFFYRDSVDSQFGKIGERIISTFEARGIEVKFKSTWSEAYHHGWLGNPFEKLVADTYKDIRIYVVLGQYYEHVGLMVALEEKGLFKTGDYFVVGVDIERYDPENPVKYMHGILKDEPEPGIVDAYRHYIGVVASPPVNFQNFTVLVNEYMEKPPFSIPNPLAFLGGYKRIRVEAAYLYDAVMLYAAVVAEAIAENQNPYNGTEVSNRMRNRMYNSAMGYSVYMDENGDAEGNYTLIFRRPHHSRPNDWGLYPVGIFRHLSSQALPELDLFEEIDWQNGEPPIDEPPCGFHGEHCISYTMEIITGVVGSLLLITFIIGLVAYRNWKYEQELDSLLWKIDFREVKPIDMGMTGSGFPQGKIKGSQISLLSNGETEQRFNSAVYAPVALYRGRLCAVKHIRRKDVDITREMKKELKMMRDLHHDNLVTFVGACIEAPNVCILTEYCSRGSLKDILENDDFHLDNMFIASLIEDLIRGMIFLHESDVWSHGNLKTSQCLVDARWVLKIAGFGLHQLKANEHYENILDDADKKYQDDFYKAPELLRDPAPPPHGTQKGDSYSFGMIVYEIHSRSDLFEDMGIPAAEIISRIKTRDPNSPPFRPRLDRLSSAPECVLNTIRDCWNEEPEARPDFKVIRAKLRPLRKGMKANIFDNMLAMMEKYANNLELLVDERTALLIEEKKKTDSLLYEMLPRFVADQLKRGMKVEAESYDAVTIYFSDIVGFTDMSAHSTPFQVVDFLNDLYTCFDSIIGYYDVYKVETIGDAYMVVSGLPVRNGEQHAAEIASMSLHLLQTVRQFRIRHRPTDTLMLRIGIHTGPVCAGVVGVKMPRYCLFGDTVNTASRMESTGIPLKIHCSSECKELLDKLGGYQFEQRGLVKMKGKGEKMTYWLTGQESECRGRLRPSESPNKNYTGLFDSRSSIKKARNLSLVRRGMPLEDQSPDDRLFKVNSLLTPLEEHELRRPSIPLALEISETFQCEDVKKTSIFRWKNEKSKVNKQGHDDSPLLGAKKEVQFSPNILVNH